VAGGGVLAMPGDGTRNRPLLYVQDYVMVSRRPHDQGRGVMSGARRSRRLRPAFAAAAVGAVALTAAVSGAGARQEAPGRADGASAAAVTVAQAKAALFANAKWPSTWKGPTTPTKAQKGKKIVVISCSQATACSLEVDGIVDGAKAIGWQTQVVDGKGDPSVYSSAIRTAVTQGADGIILASINVGLVVDALRFAKDH